MLDIIGGILVLVGISVVWSLFKFFLRLGWNKATEPKDTLKKVERDARLVASAHGFSGKVAEAYSNQQRFGVCFVRFALRVAAADGEIDRAEGQAILNFFAGADPSYIQGLTETIRRDIQNPAAIDWDHNLNVMRKVLASPEFEGYDSLIFDGLLSISAADGRIDDSELQTIYATMAELGWHEDQILQYLDYRFGTAGGRGIEAEYRQALKVLGLTPGCTLEEIKSSYRKLIKTAHPDALSGLGQQFHESAKQRYHSIQNAYEFLLKYQPQLQV